MFWCQPSDAATQSSAVQDDGASNVPEENYAQKAIKATIAELQERWKCAIHSKNKEVYCWQSNGICYELSFHNLGFWAIEIVGFDIDDSDDADEAFINSTDSIPLTERRSGYN